MSRTLLAISSLPSARFQFRFRTRFRTRFHTGANNWVAAGLAALMLAGLARPSLGDVEMRVSPVVTAFTTLVRGSGTSRAAALRWVTDNWQPDWVPMAITASDMRLRRGTAGDLVALLESKTGQTFGYDFSAWRRWAWSLDLPSHPGYAQVKGRAYGLIDPVFETHFWARSAQFPTPEIRLEEIVWGGVERDGIPPLRNPPMVAADEASYLAPSDVVFGVALNGQARAYPKRILGWHEMVTDTIGDVPIAAVY